MRAYPMRNKKGSLTTIEQKKLEGKDIFLSAESLIQKYNLEGKREKKKELMQNFDDFVYMLWGMYLKGQ